MYFTHRVLWSVSMRRNENSGTDASDSVATHADHDEESCNNNYSLHLSSDVDSICKNCSFWKNRSWIRSCCIKLDIRICKNIKHFCICNICCRVEWDCLENVHLHTQSNGMENAVNWIMLLASNFQLEEKWRWFRQVYEKYQTFQCISFLICWNKLRMHLWVSQAGFTSDWFHAVNFRLSTR